MKTKNLTFGEAAESLKKNQMVRRSSWYPFEFVFRQIPAEISAEIVPKMQSLPQSVKDEFQRRFNNEEEQVDNIYYDNQLAFVNRSLLIQSYSPSVADSLAEDWEIYNS